jgi:DNA-binding NarL/FixJ family response regulator
MIRHVHGLLLSRAAYRRGSVGQGGVNVRTVLVCVRTPAAAREVTSYAARLGLGAFRTAVSEADVMSELAERPAELILVDVLLCRPDTVGFTQRVLTLAPGAALVLFGTVEPQVAAATVAAGARGVIRGDADPVTTVAKALLLISSNRRRAAPAVPPSLTAPVEPVPGELAETDQPAGPDPTRSGDAGPPADHSVPVVVPVQRGDPAGGDEHVPGRRTALTERELQVLRGMAEGKSNAEIGRDLFVSEDTVKTHARRLFRKLNARDRAHAVAVGFRVGALP